jgi:DNA-binding NarL/FixJ family response regulator
VSVGVIVVDDNALFRAGLVTVLSSDPQITVVGEASGGFEAIEVVRAHRPDVVLLDIEMPNGDGISATRQLVALPSPPRVLILTMFDIDEYVIDALRAGASGFLIKSTDPVGLIQAVHACAAGQSTVGPTVMRRLVEALGPSSRERVPGLERLTEREMDVLRLMARGRSNAEIGAELYLAETTVKTHVGRIFDKLGVRDRVQAVIAAHRAGVDR